MSFGPTSGEILTQTEADTDPASKELNDLEMDIVHKKSEKLTLNEQQKNQPEGQINILRKYLQRIKIVI